MHSQAPPRPPCLPRETIVCQGFRRFHLSIPLLMQGNALKVDDPPPALLSQPAKVDNAVLVLHRRRRLQLYLRNSSRPVTRNYPDSDLTTVDSFPKISTTLTA